MAFYTFISPSESERMIHFFNPHNIVARPTPNNIVIAVKVGVESCHPMMRFLPVGSLVQTHKRQQACKYVMLQQFQQLGG